VADTNEILEASRKLGQLIATNPAVDSYKTVLRQLDLDVAAQEMLGKFQQLMQHAMMKEQYGQPLDINEKTALQSMSQSIKLHPLLSKFFKAQEEYSGLMQSVQEQINVGLSGQAPADGTPAAEPSKIILE
jgi:cell fate (sporulation/competence/biofilm development) regulator YlbF (YheA/YmcA/DUF963 family)